jgi:predicted kinase
MVIHGNGVMKMPKCYQLVGVPASGKSTWIDSQDWALACARVSTDKWVEIYAKEVGRTYSEVFADFMPTAVDLMAKEVVAAREADRDIIWDQTSTTLASRTRKFNMLPDYEHIAVVFKTPDKKELDRRLASRPGKEIPDHVIASMIASFEMPTEEEGFKEIWFV